MLNRLAATTHLLSKELRLQRSNAVFTLAILLLGALALITAKGAGPKIAGFSTEEIRIGLYITVLLPILIIILPLMIGSTAAAAEKAAGVWAWQAALPISRRCVILTKVLIVALLCSIAAGIAPYILEYALPSDSKTNLSIFRAVWPGWVGLLCGAIGFYAGSLARDDYQGLLISPIPLAALVFVMYIADPGFLIFPGPFGWGEPFWKEWALALRLILIATLFIGCAAPFVMQNKQHRLRRITAHATLIAAATFTLTLWNIVTERTMIMEPQQQNGAVFGCIPAAGIGDATIYNAPYKLATTVRPDNAVFSAQIHLNNAYGFADAPVIFGYVSRHWWLTSDGSDFNTGGHIFTVTPKREIREFPQAAKHRPTGITKNGHWILADDIKTKNPIIYGPMGITIESKWFPGNWFSLFTDSFDFIKKKPENFVSLIINDNQDTISTIMVNPDAIGYGTITKNGKYVTASDDLEWAMVASKGFTTYTLTQLYHDQYPAPILFTGTTSPTAALKLKQWTITATNDADSSTTVRMFPNNQGFPIVKISGQKYAWFSYRKTGPISLGGNVVNATFSYESGIALLNLGTGRKSFIPIAMPWPPAAVMNLQKTAADPTRNQSGGPRQPLFKHGKSGQFVAFQPPYTAIFKLIREQSGQFSARANHSLVPNIHEGQFLDYNQFLATDGQNLWLIQGTWTSPTN